MWTCPPLEEIPWCLLFVDRFLFLTRSLLSWCWLTLLAKSSECGQTYKFPQQRKKQHFVWKNCGWTPAFPGNPFQSAFYVSLYVDEYFPAQGQNLTKFLSGLFPELFPHLSLSFWDKLLHEVGLSARAKTGRGLPVSQSKSVKNLAGLQSGDIW